MEKRESATLAAIKESSPLIFGELIVSAIIVAVYLIIGAYEYKVLTGVLLGSLVIIANYFFLSLSINRAVMDFLKIRGTEELDEEQIEKFTLEHSSRVQSAAARSYIIRTVSMLAALVGAFLLEWFAVLPTLIPLLMLRPIIYVQELIRKKKGDKNGFIG